MASRMAKIEWDTEHDRPAWFSGWVGPPVATLNGKFSFSELRALAHFAPIPTQEKTWL
jgi:hypothetical protein